MDRWSTVAGAVATALFTVALLPMVAKAARTRDLTSYSGGNLAMANVGNVINWLYVAGLPVGPVWIMHGVNTAAGATMLSWWIRGRRRAAETVATSMRV